MTSNTQIHCCRLNSHKNGSTCPSQSTAYCKSCYILPYKGICQICALPESISRSLISKLISKSQSGDTGQELWPLLARDRTLTLCETVQKPPTAYTMTPQCWALLQDTPSIGEPCPPCRWGGPALTVRSYGMNLAVGLRVIHNQGRW